MPPKSADIDEALVQRLIGDAELQALMPDGVYFDEAPGSLRRFVLLSLVSEEDHATFGGWREFEDGVYRIQAVALDITSDSANAAAGRIDALLENQPLVVAEYSWMTTHREGRFRRTTADPVDSSLRWQVSGGNYRVQMAPVWPPTAGKERRS